MNMKKWLKNYSRQIMVVIILLVTIPLSAKLSIARNDLSRINLDRPLGIQLIAEMTGEIRTVIAAYILIKSDNYHHQRENNIDWRQDAATLPLHRLITAFDPKLVQSYDFAAYHLAVNMKKLDQALDFINEGLQYNPDSFVLHSTKGEIYYMSKDFENANRMYKKALQLSSDQVDRMNTLRRLYWVNRKMKKYDEALNYLWLQEIAEETKNDAHIANLRKETEQLMSGEKTDDDFAVKDTDEQRDTIENKIQEDKKTHEDKTCPCCDPIDKALRKQMEEQEK